MRRSARKLALAALRHHGPLTDNQLAWWLSHFHVAAATAKKARWALVKDGMVRFAKRVRVIGSTTEMLWEVTP